MKTATLVAKLPSARTDARVYELSESMTWHRWDGDKEKEELATHVVVSAAVVPFGGPETYIFPAGKDEGGDWQIADWLELEGSFRGGLDHAEALRRAGYEVAASQKAQP